MKVCIVTATRAEFGLLQGLMRKIQGSSSLELKLIVTGTHLLDSFGHTVDAITGAGFTVDLEVRELAQADTGRDVAIQVGKGLVALEAAFTSLSPDIVLVLGDRYEMLSVALAAFFLQIPVAHIHGGELTEGAFDDSTRHAITKMAHLHFVAHDDYARRVIQMGEQPHSVHVVGGLGPDEINNIKLVPENKLLSELGVERVGHLFLVTFHPVTAGPRSNIEQTQALLSALTDFESATVIFTMPNADPEHAEIHELIRDAVLAAPQRWYYFQSLGQIKYWSLMAICSAVVGNSSSGLSEAPSFKIPTVNIGTRQRGRIVAGSVLTCDADRESIARALRKAVSPAFKSRVSKVANPLGAGGASQKIVSVLESLDFATLSEKVFYDLPREGAATTHVR